jgi:hypothetical protein
MHTTDTATGMIREVLLRSIMLKWIERDIEGVKKLKDSHIWVEGMYEPLHRAILSEMNGIKRTMMSKAIFVTKQRIDKHDNTIYIEFKDQGYEHSASYPLATLYPEVKAMIKNIMNKQFAV